MLLLGGKSEGVGMEGIRGGAWSKKKRILGHTLPELRRID